MFLRETRHATATWSQDCTTGQYLMICTEILPVNVSDCSDLISLITNLIKDPRYSLIIVQWRQLQESTLTTLPILINTSAV